MRLQALIGSIVLLRDILRNGDSALPLQALFVRWSQQHVQGDNRALPRRGEDVRQFSGINELPWPDENLTRASDLRDAVLGERDLGIASTVAVDGPFGLAGCVPQRLETR